MKAGGQQSDRGVRGDIYEIVINATGVYEGDLKHYFKAVFRNAQNANLPYHNLRHIFHVTWLCHDACHFYSKVLSKREMRNLLIASMFHDFDHTGRVGCDDINIELAVRGIQKFAAPEDLPHLPAIIEIIRSTEYPYGVSSKELTLSSQIIRDADLTQCLDPTWLQQVVFGLAAEWKLDPETVLRGQPDFQKNLRFNTDWARSRWPEQKVVEKIEEVKKLIELLE